MGTVAGCLPGIFLSQHLIIKTLILSYFTMPLIRFAQIYAHKNLAIFPNHSVLNLIIITQLKYKIHHKKMNINTEQ